jgi:hypothetical protein
MASSTQRSSSAGSRTTTSSNGGRSRSAATKQVRRSSGDSRKPSSRAGGKQMFEKVARTIGTAAKKAKVPLVAGSAAAAGMAAGTVLGSRLQANRRSHVLGVPMPWRSELKSAAKHTARAGQWIAAMQADVQAVRAQAEQSRRESPIEVLLSGLTSRRLPRHD